MKMKLQYRGNFYEANSQFIETVESQITGNYRGATYKIKQSVNPTVPDSIVNLKYRGVAYIKGQNSGAWLSRESRSINLNDTQPTC
ncbi:DUF4278 domain-containing protein [Funiculus sociatus GB2-M2]|uniref:DUF4278 domain-containing protein n=1 Tax=Cyanophyceae TaxID=3028117 RepID=UPI0018F0461C|nr:DUF4278 domain-containing protein [Trichocoleus sp. FACHB-90]